MANSANVNPISTQIMRLDGNTDYKHSMGIGVLPLDAPPVQFQSGYNFETTSLMANSANVNPISTQRMRLNGNTDYEHSMGIGVLPFDAPPVEFQSGYNFETTSLMANSANVNPIPTQIMRSDGNTDYAHPRGVGVLLFDAPPVEFQPGCDFETTRLMVNSADVYPISTQIMRSDGIRD